ncbi:MAG: hypothetical protein ACR2I4_09200 [Actinomycetota bacterium]|nr:hypothetical protein [Actinomycetota bacterium]
MATVAAQRLQAMPREVGARPQLSSREHLITVLLAAWMTAGIFIDGWAHINLTRLETFFTPWHAVFYSGFLATAGWVSYEALRFQPRPRAFDRAAVPAGYLVGLLGILLFGLGGVADMLWHVIFGIEVGIDALLSPSHIVLFMGGLLIGSSPLRALWHAHGPPSSYAPILGSLTLTTAGLAFFFLYLSPFTDLTPTTSFVEWAKRAPAELGYADINLSLGVAGFLLSTVILVTPLLLALLRFRLPFGSATLIFTTVAFGLIAMHEFQPAAPLLGAFIGGLLSDVTLAKLRPSPERPAALCAAGALLPALLWASHFGVLAVGYGIGWPAELWTGVIVLSSLMGLLIAFLLVLPRPRTAPA